ncbi:polysaccharide pyruvyl transferase family protein [bacterium]|nr:polysaccharide pyruvyl transferase family protein [bacterium]
MRIVLADCYHDSDKGGGGILAGAVRSIERVCAEQDVKPELSLLFRFSDDDPAFGNAARFSSREFPDCAILPAPVSSRRGPGWRWLPWALRALIAAPLRLLFPRLSRHPAVRAMRQADVVIFKGGNFYRSWSRCVLPDAVALFLLTYTLLLARRLGKRTCVISHTFGPFHSRLSHRLMGWALRHADYISCREEPSRQALLACGLPPEAVHVTPDTGFGAWAAPDIAALLAQHSLEPGAYAAVTARPWFYGDDSAYRAYVAAMAKLCDHLVETVGAVALVVQNDGSHSRNEPDLPPLRDILAAMIRGDRATLIDADLPFDALTAIYGHGALTLGTRLHSCIFSLAAGTPPIAVAYSHKAIGIMGMASAGDYVLDIANLSVADGVRMIDDVLARRDELSARQTARVAELRSEIDGMMRTVLFPD